ncbi:MULTISPECIES: nitrogenase cofactor biosynthesis protein NifB [Clostridium]|uniref:nitrogenase cofactor biosynthesis protein NifB n=1 Tax=Clostridium TaxID=1485 RepID=UPI00082519EE|nr:MULTISPECIES: nitrogenase cofactor biosynthesis protein NifB [Clostridium]PJI07405.1 nitrogenase cofactor biosynthesis protein NifB [Clostridium sp. CT7]
MITNTEELENIAEKTLKHPCYNCIAHKYARMHIPVAPKCNVSCNFCNRKYDCVNETRPGVTSEVLSPELAVEKFKIVKDKVKNLTVIGIAGPGDPLANFEQVKKSIELIKKESPNMTFCISTNGLMLPFYANELINLGVSHITITINAVDPKISAKIYKFVNYLGQTFKGKEAGEILLHNQLSGLRYVTERGIISKINIVMIKGINDEHVPEIVKKVKECGAYMTNIMPLIPVKGSVFQDRSTVNDIELNSMRKNCNQYLKQMYHCKQCRADAIGTLDNDISRKFDLNEIRNKDIKKISYRFAVASSSGEMVDEHFGHASQFYIYDYQNGESQFIEKRNAVKSCFDPSECGNHDDRIASIINLIKDCSAVLAIRAGFEPTSILNENGIKLFQTFSTIEKGIEAAAKTMENENI